MNKILFFLIISLFVPLSLNAVEAGKWNFVVENDYCYIGSAPIKEEGDYTQRGDTYILVYRINKNPEKHIQITAGYYYDENKKVIVDIDKLSYEFYGKDDSAWSKNNNDEKIIFAMKKGMEMEVQGYSSRGTLTTDTYSLKGFTSAFNKLSKDC